MSDCIDHGKKGDEFGYAKQHGTRLHRKVFEQHNGFLPPVVMHTCDNPRCINPEHLKAGDWNLNNKDRAAKGRSAKHRKDLRVLSFEDAQAIRARWVPGKNHGGNSATIMAAEYGVHHVTIYNILKGKTHNE